VQEDSLVAGSLDAGDKLGPPELVDIWSPQRTTPSRANSSAAAAPMPDAPPVTNATLP
jgi:hypothetical protein